MAHGGESKLSNGITGLLVWRVLLMTADITFGQAEVSFRPEKKGSPESFVGKSWIEDQT